VTISDVVFISVVGADAVFVADDICEAVVVYDAVGVAIVAVEFVVCSIDVKVVASELIVVTW
jgi:hypothetical protein